MKIRQSANRRSYKLVFLEWVIVGYVTYFAALSLEWMSIINSANTYVTIVNGLIFGTSIVLINLSVGLYESKLREPFRAIIRRIFVSAILTFFIVSIITGIFLQDFIAHPLYAPTAVPLIIIALVIFRYYIHSSDTLVTRPKTVVLGFGARASIIEKRMRRDVDRATFELVGFVPIAGDDINNGVLNEKRLELDIEKDLSSFIYENDIQEIVIACDQRRGTLPTELLFEARLKGVQVTDLLDFIERETGQISVDLMYPSWVIYSNGFESQNYFREIADYWLNVSLAIVILALMWPVMLITALIIFFDDGYKTGAPILYRQRRVGLNGNTFEILKFRSMRQDAEKDGAKWAQKNDVRVTAIGGFIRKYRIDELPQLFNVLKGEMSFYWSTSGTSRIC